MVLYCVFVVMLFPSAVRKWLISLVNFPELSKLFYEAGCMVNAVKVSLPQLNIWEYVKCDIHLAPENLPDGLYKVTFEGRTMEVKRLDGYWLDGM